MEVFRSGISGTASMTKSTFERSSIFVVGKRRSREADASSCDMRFLMISFSRSLSVVEIRSWFEFCSAAAFADLQRSGPCQSKLVSCPPASQVSAPFELQRALCLIPDLLLLVWDSRDRRLYWPQMASFTICPAPTTPSLLTSAADSW